MWRYATLALVGLAALALAYALRGYLPQPLLDVLRSGRAMVVEVLVGPAQRARQSEGLLQSVNENWATLAELPAPCVSWDGRQYRSAVETIGGVGGGRRPILIFSDYRCGFCRADVDKVEQRIRSQPETAFCFVETPLLGPASNELATQALARALAGEDYLDVRRSMFRGVGLSSDAPSPEVMDQARELAARNLDVAHQVGIGGIPIYVLEDRAVFGALDD